MDPRDDETSMDDADRQDLLSRFPTPPPPLGAGTGMILTSTGEILTNNHVIHGATRIEVTSPSLNRTWTATALGVDPTGDVALLQLQGASGLPTVPLGDSSGARIGGDV